MRIEHCGRRPAAAGVGTFGADLPRYFAIVRAMTSIRGREHHLDAGQRELGGPERGRATVTAAEIATVLTQWQIEVCAASSLKHRRTALAHLCRVLDSPQAASRARGVRSSGSRIPRPVASRIAWCEAS